MVLICEILTNVCTVHHNLHTWSFTEKIYYAYNIPVVCVQYNTTRQMRWDSEKESEFHKNTSQKVIVILFQILCFPHDQCNEWHVICPNVKTRPSTIITTWPLLTPFLPSLFPSIFLITHLSVHPINFRLNSSFEKMISVLKVFFFRSIIIT